MSPRIPVIESRLPVESPVPATGQRSVSGWSPLPAALDEIGKAVGNLGQAIYQRELKHREEDKKTYIEQYESENVVKPLNNFLIDMAGKQGSDVLDVWRNVQEFQKDLIAKDPTDLANISKTDYLGKRMHDIGGFTENEKIGIRLGLQGAIEKFNVRLAEKVAEARNLVKVQTSQEKVSDAILSMQQGVLTLDEVIGSIEVIYDGKGFGKEEKNIYVKNEIQRATVAFLDQAMDDGNMNVVNEIIEGKYNAQLMGAQGDVRIVNQYRSMALQAKASIVVDTKYNQMKLKYGNNFEAMMKDVREDKSLSLSQQKSVLATIRTEQNDFDEINHKAEKQGHDNDIDTIYGFINQKKSKAALKATRDSHFLDEREKAVIYDKLENGDNPFSKSDPATTMEIYNRIMGGQYAEDYRFSASPGVLNIKDAEHFTELNKQMHKEDITARKDATRYIQKSIIQGGGGKIAWSFNADGSISMDTNASPELQRKAYNASKELNNALDEGVRKGKNIRDMVTPGTPDYVVDKVIMGNSPSFKDSVSSRVQKLKKGDLWNEIKGFKTTEDAVNYLINTYGYSKTQATDLVREGHRAGYF